MHIKGDADTTVSALGFFKVPALSQAASLVQYMTLASVSTHLNRDILYGGEGKQVAQLDANGSLTV